MKKLLAYKPPWEKDHFASLDCLCPVIDNICIASVEVNCAEYNKIGKRVQGMRDNLALLLHTCTINDDCTGPEGRSCQYIPVDMYDFVFWKAHQTYLPNSSASLGPPGSD